MNAVAARAWSYRAQVELDAAARFRRLAADLERANALPIVVKLAREAADDEARHAELCAALAVHLGGAAPRLLSRDAAPFQAVGLSPREAVLTETVIASCITETVAATALGELREQAADPLVRATVQQILRDEIGHARLGWAHLAAESERGPVGFLSELLPKLIALTIGEELFSSGDAPGETPELGGLGALPRARRRELFEDTLSEVIFPGLEQHGVDAEPARRWLRAHRHG